MPRKPGSRQAASSSSLGPPVSSSAHSLCSRYLAGGCPGWRQPQAGISGSLCMVASAFPYIMPRRRTESSSPPAAAARNQWAASSDPGTRPRRGTPRPDGPGRRRGPARPQRGTNAPPRTCHTGHPPPPRGTSGRAGTAPRPRPGGRERGGPHPVRPRPAGATRSGRLCRGCHGHR